MISHQSEPQPSLLRRMGTTPMRDWIRGRLTGRLDRERAIEASGLPGPLSQLIRQVVRRTRLWRTEKVEVTRELIAHFRDGLASGADPAGLAADFGDPARAARLIRRAKRRGRPLPWRAMIYTRNALACLLLAAAAVYTVLAVRYLTGRPTIARDYLAELNAHTLSIPEDRRAWPVYREGLLQLPLLPDSLDKVHGLYRSLPSDDPRKATYIQYLRECAPALERFARAASIPDFGYILTVEPETQIDEHFARLRGLKPAPSVRTPRPPGDRPFLFEVLLPYLGHFRHAARITAADCRLAVEDQDRERAVRDLRALIGMTGHMLDEPFLVGQLVGVALAALTSDEIMRTAQDGILTEADLRDLAHRLSAVGGGDLRIRFDAESKMFEDCLQQLFTDDGRGDGRLVASALERLRPLTSTDMVFPAERDAFSNAVGPVIMGLTAGRADIDRMYRSLMADAIAYSARPMWERGEPTVIESVERMTEDPLEKARYWPILMLVPATDRIQSSADVAAQRCDAALIVLALELHRLRRGAYPERLDQLVPDYLPALPPDRFDGTPVKYRLEEGGPVLYSVGPDRKDDQGRAPRTRSQAIQRWVSPKQAEAMLKDVGQRDQIDGDWILFPPPALEPPPPVPAVPASEPQTAPEPGPAAPQAG